MTIKEIMMKIESGSTIRRASWPKDAVLHVTRVMAYRGTDFGFTPDAYAPEGMLVNGKDRTPFWCFPNNRANDWEIV